MNKHVRAGLRLLMAVVGFLVATVPPYYIARHLGDQGIGRWGSGELPFAFEYLVTFVSCNAAIFVLCSVLLVIKDWAYREY